MLSLLKPGQVVFRAHAAPGLWHLSIEHADEVQRRESQNPNLGGYYDVVESHPDYVLLQRRRSHSKIAVSAEAITEIHLLRERKAEAEIE